MHSVIYQFIFFSALPQNILFSAKLSSPTVRNSILQYTDVTTNTGNGYDPTQCTFVAPVQGDYLFTWSIPQLGRRYSYSSIVKNDSPLLYETVGMGSVDGMDSASQTIALHLSAGDRVWIKYQGGTCNNVPYIDKNYNGVFTGFLLW